MSTSALAKNRYGLKSNRFIEGCASSWSRRWADLLAVCALVTVMSLVLLSRFDGAAVLHDMGTLGHAAERVLLGELPHADFDDPYTGLLSLWNALAFRLFGVSVLSARVPLLLCTTVAFAALYGMCRRTMSVGTSSGITIAAFLASVPNYFTPMPTWYNLFATIGAVAAMLRFAATERYRWLIVAGACAGISFLFKSVGLYAVAASALFAVYYEQERSESRPKVLFSPHASWVTIAGLCFYAACVFGLVASNGALPEFVTFFAPSLVLVVYLSCNEFRLRFQESGLRLRRLIRHGAVFAAGFASVVGVFLLPYLAEGKVYSWYRGVFVRPLIRLEDEMMGRPLEAASFIGGAFLMSLLMLGVAIVRKEEHTGRAIALIAAIICGTMLMFGGEPSAYAAMWSFARLIPLAASVGLCLELWSRHRIVRRKRDARNVRSAVDEGAFLLVAAAAVFSLVQIPLAHGIYFLYAAPLIIIAAAQVLAAHFPQRRYAVGMFAAAVGSFAAFWVLPAHFAMFGTKYFAATDTEHFIGTRCPTTCDPITAQQYAELVQEVRSRTAKDEAILAFPDSPDVYFMTNRRNPTRTFFDALDADYGTPARDARLLKAIETNDVDLVVLRNLVEFSHEAVTPTLLEELRRRFPHAKEITGGVFPRFTLYWRDRSPAPPDTSSKLAGK